MNLKDYTWRNSVVKLLNTSKYGEHPKSKETKELKKELKQLNETLKPLKQLVV